MCERLHLKRVAHLTRLLGDRNHRRVDLRMHDPWPSRAHRERAPCLEGPDFRDGAEPAIIDELAQPADPEESLTSDGPDAEELPDGLRTPDRAIGPSSLIKTSARVSGPRRSEVREHTPVRMTPEWAGLPEATVQLIGKLEAIVRALILVIAHEPTELAPDREPRGIREPERCSSARRKAVGKVEADKDAPSRIHVADQHGPDLVDRKRPGPGVAGRWCDEAIAFPLGRVPPDAVAPRLRTPVRTPVDDDVSIERCARAGQEPRCRMRVLDPGSAFVTGLP